MSFEQIPGVAEAPKFENNEASHEIRERIADKFKESIFEFYARREADLSEN